MSLVDWTENSHLVFQFYIHMNKIKFIVVIMK